MKLHTVEEELENFTYGKQISQKNGKNKRVFITIVAECHYRCEIQ